MTDSATPVASNADGGPASNADGGPAPTTEAAPRARKSRLRTVGYPVLSLVLIVAVAWYFLPKFTSISAVWASIRGLSALQLTILAVAALWNLATYWFVMVSTMPGLTYPQAAVVTEASTAVSNTVPAGGAIGIAMSYAMYTSWGFSRSRSSVSLLLSGIWNNFAKLGMPLLALALLALQGNPSGGKLVAGLAGLAGLVGAIVVFALILKSEETAHKAGVLFGRWASALRRLFRRPPVHGWELATTKFRARTILLLRARWHWLTLATLVSHFSLYVVLLIALRQLGVSNSDVSWAEVLAAFAFTRLVTAIPFTPGGVGLVEFALIAWLTLAGGARPAVAAAVLMFRALTYVLPIPIGLLSYVYWRRNKSWRRPPGQAPRTALVPEST